MGRGRGRGKGSLRERERDRERLTDQGTGSACCSFRAFPRVRPARTADHDSTSRPPACGPGQPDGPAEAGLCAHHCRRRPSPAPLPTTSQRRRASRRRRRRATGLAGQRSPGPARAGQPGEAGTASCCRRGWGRRRRHGRGRGAVHGAGRQARPAAATPHGPILGRTAQYWLRRDACADPPTAAAPRRRCAPPRSFAPYYGIVSPRRRVGQRFPVAAGGPSKRPERLGGREGREDGWKEGLLGGCGRGSRGGLVFGGLDGGGSG